MNILFLFFLYYMLYHFFDPRYRLAYSIYVRCAVSIYHSRFGAFFILVLDLDVQVIVFRCGLVSTNTLVSHVIWFENTIAFDANFSFFNFGVVGEFHFFT
jgi:hypothetical protein